MGDVGQGEPWVLKCRTAHLSVINSSDLSDTHCAYIYIHTRYDINSNVRV